MICPYCANDKTTVVCTISDMIVERYRRCSNCGGTFPTVETVKVGSDLTAYKKVQDDMVKKKL